MPKGRSPEQMREILRKRWAPPVVRFAAQYQVDNATGCWIWTGDRDTCGYGRIRSEGKQHKAHRFSYALHVGPVPTGMSVCHRCDTPACVNPDHLFLASHAENMRDMSLKGRARPRGNRMKRRPEWWTPERDAVVASLWGKVRSADIAQHLGDPSLNRCDIHRRAKALGLPPIARSTFYAWTAETHRKRARGQP